METLISQNFEFNVLSIAYAQFILECSNGYPEGRIEKISHEYQSNIDPGSIIVNFKSPESIAVFLKLKFGAHLCEFPNKGQFPSADYITELEMKVRKMSIYDSPRWIKGSTYEWDLDEYRKDIINKIQNYKGTSTKE